MTTRRILAATVLLLAIATAARADVPAQAYGDWKGSASVGAGALRIALHLGATSTMDSPDQGAMGLAAASVSNGRHLTLTVAGVGVIEGDLSEDGQTLSMVVKQGAGLPVVLTRGTYATPARPQTPMPPFPYAAREVAFDNPAPGGGRLAGTLTTPMVAGPFPTVFPTVVLITGSGSQDRTRRSLATSPSWCWPTP
ncbi:MAG: putative lipoprotein [Caulobacteraceae bacterium]|nr:putative lipoprotein [Caulobacteraceae bacterium]